VAVAPVQWVMAIGRMVPYQMAAEAGCLEMEDAEAQRLGPEEMGRPTAPRASLNNLDRLVNWSNELLSSRDNDRTYPVLIIRDEQFIIGI
jgi:hypothetical protein